MITVNEKHFSEAHPINSVYSDAKLLFMVFVHQVYTPVADRSKNKQIFVERVLKINESWFLIPEERSLKCS